MFGYLMVIVLGLGVGYASASLRPVIIGGIEVGPPDVAEYQTADCPEAGVFMRGSSWTILVPPPRSGRIWQQVRGALSAWREGNFPSARGDVVLLMGPDPSGHMQQTGVQSQEARTCYVVGRVPDTGLELRMAFWFSYRPAPESETDGALVVQWVGDIRGAGERKWQADLKWPGMFAQDLIERIEHTGD